MSATQRRDLRTFSRLALSMPGDVRVHIGPAQSLAVTADDNLLDLISTEVRADTLVLEAKQAYASKVGVVVDITVPSLDRATVTSSGGITVRGLIGARFAVSVRGSGSVRASGSADELRVDVAGSGKAALDDLTARAVRVTVSGGGSAEVHASGSLKASVRGSGSILSSGNPETAAVSISGSGSVISQ